MEGACVILALNAKGRPVKLVMSREEEFYTTFVRQGLVAKIKLGMTRDGRITAMHNTYYWDAGAYTEYGVNIARAAGYSSTGPYFVANVHANSFCVYTNHPIGGAMRGFGMPEIHWAIEQHLDRTAAQLGLDPVQVRLLNCLKDGQETVTGMIMHPTGLSQCIAKAAEAIEWDKPSKPSGPGKRRGKGIAAMWKAPAMPPNPGSSATIRFNEDGTCLVNVGGVDMGQGALTVAAQFAAEGLGISHRRRTRQHGGHRLLALRMADGGQPHHLEHGQCDHVERPRKPRSRSSRWSPRSGARTRRTWTSSTATWSPMPPRNRCR